MVLLNDYCIFIDDFRSRKNYSCKHPTNEPIFLLTHAHVDHTMNAKNIKFNVVCTKTTALIADLKQIDEIVPGMTYEIKRKKDTVLFTVFETLHSPGSVGFYFHHPINILHLGDSRIDKKLIKDLKTLTSKNLIPPQIYTDPTRIKHINIKTYPTMNWSREKLLYLWEQAKGDLVVGVHSDSIALLFTGIFTPIPVKNKVLRERIPEVRPNVWRAMSVISQNNRKVQICGRLKKQGFDCKSSSTVFVEPSMLYFVNDTFPIDTKKVSTDNRGVVKLFFGTHASPKETQMLTSSLQ